MLWPLQNLRLTKCLFPIKYWNADRNKTTRLSFSVQCPKLQRRHTGSLAKKAGEIGRIFITQFVRNLPDIEFAIIKQPFGFQEDLLLYPIPNRKARNTPDRLI